jgi:peroxiredoxin
MIKHRSRFFLYFNLTLSFIFLGAGLFLLFLANRPAFSPPDSLANLPRLQPGAAAPLFTLDTLAGEKVGLEDYNGQVVVLNFWATWCTPCKIEMPMLDEFYTTHRSAGLVVLAINDQEEKTTVAAFIREAGYRFPVLLDPDAELIERYLIPGLPTTIVIDRTGVIQHIQLGLISDQQLRAVVEPLL